MKRKVIFFDRDGTLIEDKHYLNDPSQVVYLKDVFNSLRELRDMGFEFVVATNQSGLSRGLVTLNNLRLIHQLMRADFSRQGIDFLEFYYSPYMPITKHSTRKPGPGMLINAARDYNIDLSQSWMVGDRMSDIEAGHRAGCKSVFLKETSFRPKELSQLPPEWAPPELIVKNHSSLPMAIKGQLKHN